ncbi:hypothetical protein GTQ40_11400 [Flavobacteriaceae bacterium R38]|nr:hypothetical protein [Flavobacteriaceae bacterium R38]
MNDLNKIIHVLSVEEKKSFISHLKEKNKRHDTKNIAFFRLLDSGTSKDWETKLYETKNRPAYNALRKRLYDNLIEFIANRDFELDYSTEKSSLKLVLAAQTFIEKKLPEIAFKILRKAENKALKTDAFKVLNEIYQLQIQYAHLGVSTSLEALISKYNKNKKKVFQEEQLNLGYAYLRKQLNNINYQGNTVDFQEIINKTIDRFNISFKDTLSFKSLYQIMFITNEYAHLNNNYYSVEDYMQKSYDEVLDKEKQIGKNRYYHILILYFMANVFFRNRKFELSRAYLEKMLDQMNGEKAKYYITFFPKYALLKSLNENYSGNHDLAIEMATNTLKTNYTHSLKETSDIILVLTIFHFQKNNFKEAINVFKRLNHTDTWYEKRLGIDWCIKKNLIEILLHIELQNIDYVVSRMISFKRRYANHLKLKKDPGEFHFFKFVEHYLNTPELISSDKFKTDSEEIFTSSKDIFAISFYAWLKSKIHKTDLLKTTLELVNHNDR